MFSRTKRRPRFSISSTLTRRWIRSRPGSVLILVIALLVLLALIGTAYLSSTQTERYTSVQNTINTEADLLIDGLKIAVNSKVEAGLFASDGTYREPSQEMPTYPGGTYTAVSLHSTYFGYDSVTTDPSLISTTAAGQPAVDAPDLFLADRIPSAPWQTKQPTWTSISWPLFKDANGGYTFDSPFSNTPTQYNAGPVPVGAGVNKGLLMFEPMALKLPDGSYAPAMQIAVPGTAAYLPDESAFVPPALPIIAADADGDGIADSLLFKLPIGPIDGITYYAATRVIDNNSAVNAGTAWSSYSDFKITGVGTAPLNDAALQANQLVNYGFFRSNVGLRELLRPTRTVTGSPDSNNQADEIDKLNAYRFNRTAPPTLGGSGPSILPSIDSAPVGDSTPGPVANAVPSSRTDFNWYSASDALEQQLARRPGNPGLYTAVASDNMAWLGTSQSSALAYRFALVNPTLTESVLERALDTETYNYPNARTTPYAASQYSAASGDGITTVQNYDKTTFWYGDLFNFNFGNLGASAASNLYMPLRTVITADNPVSNAMASRFGNTTSSGPPVWSSTTAYQFGDWVTYTNPVTNQQYSYVCLLYSLGNSPGTLGAPPANIEYWVQVPWTTQPVKTSINTATFDQLWLGFCHVMTDTVTTPAIATVPQWQPPMLPLNQMGNYSEVQEPMFRSVIRDNRYYPIANDTGSAANSNSGNPKKSFTSAQRVQLTPMQMMQLRAAIAAINTQAMRNAGAIVGSTPPANQQSRSHRIVLGDNSGTPAYDVEVFSTDMQPYIGQVYATTDSNGAPSFIAIQLLNPYPVPINITTNWAFATIDRGAPNGTTPGMMLTNAVATVVPFTILAATTAAPTFTTIYDGTKPPNFTLPTGATAESGLLQGIGKELVILKTRRFDGAPSQGTGEDTFNEGTTGTPNIYDLEPVDQIDLSGAAALPPPAYMIYRRAALPPPAGVSPAPSSYAWNFVWPGFYTPYNLVNPAQDSGPQSNTVAVKPPFATTPAAATGQQYLLSQPIIVLNAEPEKGLVDFGILTGGTADPAATATSNPALSSATTPTYNTIPLQINNVGYPGPNPIASVPPNSFPFGGFARNVDLMQVPFIGAYRIAQYPFSSATATFYEMNSVTMDSSLANDSTLQPSNASMPAYATNYPSQKVLPAIDAYSPPNSGVTVPADSVSDPFVEQIGRFCPVGNATAPGLLPDPKQLLDFGKGFDTTDTAPGSDWHYHWTKRLFDYFTVQAPHDDYFPNNVDPIGPDTTVTSTAATPPETQLPSKYPNATGPIIPSTTSMVVPVNNSQTTVSTSANYFANGLVPKLSEDTVGVQGLININTAPWPVLAQLPFVTAGTDNFGFSDITNTLSPTLPARGTPPSGMPNLVDDNVDIAKAIVAYRNQYGPFQSIEDLYKVPAIQLETEFMLTSDPVCAAAGSAPPLSSTFPLPVPGPSVIPVPIVGDFTGDPTSIPSHPVADHIRYDFEERFLILNQISNLITTHSDTFTCYVLLQGWRNVGTANPTLAVERRASFLVDRNAITPMNTQTSTFNFAH